MRPPACNYWQICCNFHESPKDSAHWGVMAPNIVDNIFSMRTRSVSLFAFIFFIAFTAKAQEETLYLTNASFEDIPRHSTPPRGWIDCGFDNESDVDVHPSGAFSVVKQPVDGNTYLGMVVRDNDTWERVSQPLSSPMIGGNCYEFSIFLSKSESYISVSKLTDSPANYNTAAKLRIYGGNDACDRAQMLAESNLVVHTRWIEYRFKFEPREDYSYILFEAFYNTPTLFPYNGNLLLDGASNLTLMPCNDDEITEEEEVVAEETTESEEETAPPVVVQTAPETVQATPPSTPPTPPADQPNEETQEEPRVIESSSFEEINKSELRAGTIIRTNQIYFEADKSDINDRSSETLQQLYQFLINHPEMRVEIGGHTNGLPPDEYCDQLSTARAKSVVEHLKNRGVASSRLEFKGYGKRQRIAPDDTLAGRRKNQRVEIKILDVGRD